MAKLAVFMLTRPDGILGEWTQLENHTTSANWSASFRPRQDLFVMARLDPATHGIGALLPTEDSPRRWVALMAGSSWPRRAKKSGTIICQKQNFVLFVFSSPDLCRAALADEVSSMEREWTVGARRG
jgi:hypothetical protein